MALMQRGPPSHRTFLVPRRWTMGVASQFGSSPRIKSPLAAVYERRTENSSRTSVASNRPYKLRQQFARASRSDLWSILTWGWAVYYFAVLSIGRYPEFERTVIWTGAGIMGLLTVVACVIRRAGVPAEALTLMVFMVWTLTGILSVEDWASYQKYLKLVAEMVLVIGAVGSVLRHSGRVNFFYVAFLFVAVFNVLFGVKSASLEELSPDSLVRETGLTGNANALGYYGFMGVLGAMALWGERSTAWVLGSVILAGTALSLYGIIVSGSRGALLVLCLATVLWVVMCYRGSGRRVWVVFVTAGVVIVLAFFVGQFILKQTYLGDRVLLGIARQESSAEKRLDYLRMGLRVLEWVICGYKSAFEALFTG